MYLWTELQYCVHDLIKRKKIARFIDPRGGRVYGYTRKFDEKRGMEKGRAEGMAKGMAEGMAKGELSKGLEVARNLLAMGMSWTQIIQATGLTEDQLKQLQS